MEKKFPRRNMEKSSSILYHALPTAHVVNHYNTNYPSFVATGNFVTFVNNRWKVRSLKYPSKGATSILFKKIHDVP